MASTLDPFALIGTQLDGKYDVESVVAEGGFGVVYRATHRALQKPVAVKVLKTPPSVPESARHAFIEKFVFEARTLARIEHPGIVRVLDFGGGSLPSGDTAPWLVLEWIDGSTLEDDLDARRGRGGRSPEEALSLLRPIFEALAVAHDEGVAHRDLKPANVMLARTRRGIEPKLLDFGIAKAMNAGEAASSHQTATQSELRAFTLAYAAPEQLGGTRTGPWTDVHALGLLLVELLTDRAPFTGEDTTALCAEVLAPVRPTPAKFGLDVGAWELVLAKALSLRPTERFQHAGELLRALDATPAPTAHRRATQHPTLPMTAPVAGGVTTLRPTTSRSVTESRTHTVWLALAIVSALVSIAALAGLVSTQRSTVTPTRAVAVGASSAPITPIAAPSVAAVAEPPRETVVDAGAIATTHAAPPPRAVIARPVRPPRAAVPARSGTHEHVPLE